HRSGRTAGQRCATCGPHGPPGRSAPGWGAGASWDAALSALCQHPLGRLRAGRQERRCRRAWRPPARLGRPPRPAATPRPPLRIPQDGALLPLEEDSEDPHVLPIASSPDGKLLATPGPDNAVVVREAATGRVVLTLRGFKKPVVALAFAPDGKTMFAMDQGQA